ncbi:reverse transcriptase domain-containing protein, partial [Tanacetum coccineum]
DMTGILQAITEHSLDTYIHIEPNVQKKRSLALDRRKVVTDEVNEWLKAGIRLADSAFKEQIGVNLEANVDDIVIKSRTEQDIIKDIEQNFSTLRMINMKLNPKKCSFGMEEGKFLGYIVTSEGIRANPEKTKGCHGHALTKNSQADAIPKWTEAAEAAFLEMKKLVSELPTLITPKKGETLMMYLAAVNEANKLCSDGETRSDPSPHGQSVEEVFPSSPDQGAYGITYVPRVAVKGHVLADFLVDTSTEINATPERLYTDGASNNGGSGAGLIMIALDDVEYSYALYLNFSNSNNDAEYEALLAGLRIAAEMQVKDIHAFVNFKLVASQVEGSYEAKGERMIKYQEKVLELAGAFNRFRITHIPRAENRKADGLSKLAAVQFDHLSKEVLVEVLNEHYVEAQEEVLPGPIDEVVAKAMNLGYYWPSMHRHARELIRACDDCEAHASWGMDIVGPLLEGSGRVKYLIVATDYFTKWIEAKPLATINGNGAVERVNRSLLRGIKTRLEKGGSAWAEEVPNVLWAHQTMKKTNNGETPFNLTYGTKAVIPAEIGMPTHRTSNLNEKNNDQELRLNLDLLDEQREIAAIREARYKQQVKKYCNKKVRHVQLKVGEFVLRKNEALRAANIGKLGPTWVGPYKVIQAFQSRAYKLSNIEGEEIPRTWHACNLRRCYM